MKVLFLDDSSQGDYQGYGGYCIDEANLAPLTVDVNKLKGRLGIPPDVELKWSLAKNHYLRTSFKGDVNLLRKDIMGLLRKYDVTIVCAIDDLRLFGKSSGHNKDLLRSMTERQLTFILERLNMHLSGSGQKGLVVMDEYSDRKGGQRIMDEAYSALVNGTDFMKLNRIAMIPLMASSHHIPHLQLADTVIGAVVAALSSKLHGTALFGDMAQLFMMKGHKKEDCEGNRHDFVVGAGLKLSGKDLFTNTRFLFSQLGNMAACKVHRGQ